jgi:hypothetical protein
MHSPLSSVLRVFATVMQASYSIVMDLRDGFNRRFALTSGGIFIHLPLTSRSLWMEWRETSVGFGLDRTDPHNTQFFAGRIQGVLSTEVAR